MTTTHPRTPAQPIDLLVQDAHVVTFDDAGTVHAGGAIAVDGGVIVDVGPVAEVAPRWAPRERLFAGGRIAIPGLTDAHLHTAQTLMRGLITTLGRRGALRVPFWREYFVPFEAMLSPEDVHLSGMLAYTTMLSTGTTTFFEAGGPHPDQMAEAAEETGIRGAVSLSTMDGGARIPDSMRMTTEEALRRNVELVERLPDDPSGKRRVTAAMSLRQVITCSLPLVTGIHAAAAERGVKVHTHLVEGTYEVDFCLEQYGRRPVDHLRELGVLTPTLHCAHVILAGPQDVDAFVTHRASACHCAMGNYAIGTPPALDMWRRGVAIGLGTDGVATLGTLDLFRVALVTRIGQQHVYGTPFHDRFAVGADEPLTMAIRGGARAMGWDRRIGSLEVGKRADVVLLSTAGPDAAAFASPEAFLFECATGRDVETVLVDGQVVVRDGSVTTVDTERVRAVAAQRQAELAGAFL